MPRSWTIAVLLATVGVAGIWAAGSAGCKSQKSPPSDKAADQPAPKLTDPRKIIAAMADAYRKATSYRDRGTLRHWVRAPESPEPEKYPFAVTFVRPNKLQTEVYETVVVCDGRRFYAKLAPLPEQVVARDAPANLTLPLLYLDPILGEAMTQRIGGAPPQLTLLLEKDAAEMLLQGAEEITLAEPGKIEGRACYRVKLRYPQGVAVFWIDQQSLALRRFEYPTEEYAQGLRRHGPLDEIVLVADFAAAELNADVPDKTFEFSPPPRSDVVKYFLPPHPGQLLGKPVPSFEFTDFAGNKIRSADLRNKLVVVNFWRSDIRPSLQGLANLDQVYHRYKDDGRAIFLAVSTDDPQIHNDTLEKLLAEWKISLPALRDPASEHLASFRIDTMPGLFLLDGGGVLQHCELAPNPELVTALPEKIEQVLAGQNIFAEPRRLYEKEVARRNKELEEMEQALASGQTAFEQNVPVAAIAPKTHPQKLRLEKLWECKELRMAGNILVVPRADGSSRLLVIEAMTAVAELTDDGKLLATHQWNLEQTGERLSALRAVNAADGRRYYAAFAVGHQRAHLFDEKWRMLWSYPPDALEHRHSGIADVQLADLDQDGQPEMYIGYYDVVGVQAVSLSGRRTAANRRLANVIRLAAAPPDPQGHGELFCIDNSGAVVVLDAQLEERRRIFIPQRPLRWIVAATLGEKDLSWCGLLLDKLGVNVAIGFNLRGEVRWNYPLPEGVPQHLVEPIVPAKLLPGASGQWLLAGADGSIHILAADGQLIDRFNHGAALHGLAAIEQDGRRVLVVASPIGVEAFAVQP